MNQNIVVHRIEAGETLYSIARKYNTTVEIILDANPYLDPTKLRIGDQITIYTKQNGSVMTPAKIALKDNMRSLWCSYIIWLRQVIVSTAHNLQDEDEVMQKLLRNAADIGNLFRIYYGDNIANKVTELYRKQITISRELLRTLKRTDMVSFERLLRDLYTNADDISFYLGSINPYYDDRAIRDLLYQHLDLLRQLTAARFGNNYNLEIKLFDRTREQLKNIADYLTNGIIEQFPNRFA